MMGAKGIAICVLAALLILWNFISEEIFPFEKSKKEMGAGIISLAFFVSLYVIWFVEN
jgi:hypothetical protein